MEISKHCLDQIESLTKFNQEEEKQLQLNSKFRKYCLYLSQYQEKESSLEKELVDDIVANLYPGWFLLITKFPKLIDKHNIYYGDLTFNLKHLDFLVKLLSPEVMSLPRMLDMELIYFCEEKIKHTFIKSPIVGISEVYSHLAKGGFGKYLSYINNISGMFFPPPYVINVMCGDKYYIDNDRRLHTYSDWQ